MTMINRTAPEVSPEVAFTELELWLLDELVEDKDNEKAERTLTAYLTKLARLGGYLARARDPLPGNTVMGEVCLA